MIIDTYYNKDKDETVIEGKRGKTKVVKRLKGMLLCLDKDFELNRALWQVKEELRNG